MNNYKKISFLVDFNTSLYLFLRSKLTRKFYRYLKSSNAKFFLNSRPILITDLINIGDTLEIFYLDKTSSYNWCDFKALIMVLYKDEDYLICYKDPHLLTIPTKKEPQSLYQALISELGYSSFKFLNRLDKETSGLVLVALDRYSASMLDICKTTRSYYAIVYGNIFDTTLSLKLDKDPDSSRRVLSDNGKLAVTRFTVIARKGAFSFIRCDLFTGRTHQIRASLFSLGVYILGDPLYSDFKYKHNFMCLESFLISFTNPLSNKFLSVRFNKL